MKFSRKTDYGLILLKSLITTYGRNSFLPVSKIAAKWNLPETFLEQLAKSLKNAGYLESKRGADGGYCLIKNPRQINLEELVRVFEEPPMVRCLHFSDPEKHCPLVHICPSHRGWQKIQGKVSNIFKKTTLVDL